MPLTNLDEKQGCRIALWLVGGIVGLLLLISVLPFEMRPGSHGPGMRARSEMQGLVLAVKGYLTEYSCFPSAESQPSKIDNTAGCDTTSAAGKGILEILIGTDAAKNQRQIPFYEPRVLIEGRGGYTKERGLVDVWGTKGYMIILDYDGDGKIADPVLPGATIAALVIVYSAGPDRDFSTWKDNVKTWD